MSNLEKYVDDNLEREEPEHDFVDLGDWYWVKQSNSTDRILMCVVHIGSNFVKFEWESGRNSCISKRVHFEEMDDICIYEPNYRQVIQDKVDYYRNAAKQNMLEVQEITARLGVTQRTQLTSGEAAKGTSELVSLSGKPDMNGYKAELIQAKEKDLPKLFEEIERNNKMMAQWLSAEVLPIKARASLGTKIMEKVGERIYHVELYAGITEEVVRIRDGKPADIRTKLHVMQRRHYMDEECLANYRIGGMIFNDLSKFDQWLCEDDNLNRIMPFERCIVAFRVRRNEKERHCPNMNGMIRLQLNELDKITFMYIRNGDIVYRMNTEINFDENIFPNLKEFKNDKLWGRVYSGMVNSFISDSQYHELVEKYEREKAEYERNNELSEKWNHDNPDHKEGNPYFGKNTFFHYRNLSDYHPFSPDDIYYDDMQKKYQDEMKKYNRVALIIQGLYDRSEVFHPHPPIQIWTNEGFDQAVKLVYDNDRALTAGKKPDFEDYRLKCNLSIKNGSVVVGQEDYWLRKEAKKERERIDRSWRQTDSYRPKRFRPWGNPGPGYIAIVSKFSKKRQMCTFEWLRERSGSNYDKWGQRRDPHIRTTVSVPVSVLFNVDAYKPGDYKQFYEDPRTRAEYLQWAPMLIMAEEYHAGNVKLKDVYEIFAKINGTCYEWGCDKTTNR